MKLRTGFAPFILLLSAGCGPGQIGVPPKVVAEWELVARADLALIDPARPGTAYPNTGEFRKVSLELRSDSAICGSFKGDVSSETCGGPTQGIPYFASPVVDEDRRLRLEVLDLFGNVVMDTPVVNGCISTQSNDCTVCSGEDGALISSDCVNDANLPPPTDTAQSCFVQGAETFVGFVNSELAELDLPDWSVDTTLLGDPMAEAANPTEIDEESSRETRRRQRFLRAFVEVCDSYGSRSIKLDEDDEHYIKSSGKLRCGYLANDGLVIGCDAPSAGCQGDDRDAFERGLLVAHNAWTGSDGEGGWAWEEQTLAAQNDENNQTNGIDPPSDYPPDGSGSGYPNDGYPNDGSGGSGDDGSGGDGSGGSGDDPGGSGGDGSGDGSGGSGDDPGGSGGGSGGSGDDPGGENDPGDPEPPECSGSPLLFSLDRRPVELSAKNHGVSFDLMGTGADVETGWVTHGSFLALDLNLNGTVDGGRELFGEATILVAGGFAKTGFEALGQYDDVVLGGNNDGRIDESDSIYPLLIVWTDHNQDGSSTREELRPVSDSGLRSIDLRATDYVDRGDVVEADNEVGLEALLEWTDGATSQIYDVWFTYRALKFRRDV